MTRETDRSEAVALTPSEEAELRQDIADHDPATAESIYGIDVLRLLATLDAERASLAALRPEREEAGLLAALLRIFDLAENRPDIREVARAALRGTGAER